MSRGRRVSVRPGSEASRRAGLSNLLADPSLCEASDRFHSDLRSRVYGPPIVSASAAWDAACSFEAELFLDELE